MTDSGNKPEWHKDNDLGGREYTDAEQRLIFWISSGLRGRDPLLTGKFVGAGYLSRNHGLPPDGVRPRDYIPAYTKVAGFILELAKNLVVFPFPPQIPPKSLEEWIRIVTDLKVPGYEEPPPGLHHVEARLLLDDKVVASTSDPDPEEQIQLTIPMVKPLEYIHVSITVPRESPASSLESIDPEKAKAILLRLCDMFPELIDGEDRPFNASDLVEELGILLRSNA